MSFSATLKINSKWNVDDIVTVLNKHCHIPKHEIKVVNKTDANPNYFWILIPVNGTTHVLNVHLSYAGAMGANTSLSFSASEACVKLLRTIGNVFGGYFQGSGCTEATEELRGMFYEEDSFVYFLKSAMLENAITTSTKSDNFEAFRSYLKNWYAEIDPNKQTY